MTGSAPIPRQKSAVTANTRECFTEFVGQKLVGVMFDNGHGSHSPGTTTFVFEDGRGLTLNRNGAHWVEPEETIRRAVRRIEGRLSQAWDEIAEVLRLAEAADKAASGSCRRSARWRLRTARLVTTSRTLFA
jgi:hypothetical protein